MSTPSLLPDDAHLELIHTRRYETRVYRLSDEERDAVREGLNSPVVSDAEVKAFRNRHKA